MHEFIWLGDKKGQDMHECIWLGDKKGQDYA